MARILLVICVLFLVVGAALGGAWWYLFGPNATDAANFVPSQTLIYASIPNGASLATSYQTSHLKELVDAENAKFFEDQSTSLLGNKTVALLEELAPNLSGQSFIAITHVDPIQPMALGLITGMKPKPGFDTFDSFVEHLKAAVPNLAAQGSTGKGSYSGIDFDWIKGPMPQQEICVARAGGWIVTSWGEEPLHDWIDRFQNKATTPSLAQSADYRKSLTRVGTWPMTLLYINGDKLRGLEPPTQQPLPFSGCALAARFENGEIVDRISMLIPRQQQLDVGFSDAPCPFDTLKFTGPDTRGYWGFSVNWTKFYQNLQNQAASATPNFIATYVANYLQAFAAGANLDIARNIVAPLGPEASIQCEWTSDSTYPDAGLLVKIDHPDDFKPTIDAILNSARQIYSSSGTIKEYEVNGQKFATLNFNQAGAFSPTITEGGPYFGFFLTQSQAASSFQRDPAQGLTQNPDFVRQLGDRRATATQMLFLDTPRLLDRGYEVALPYITIAGMFNRDVGRIVGSGKLPKNLDWLAPAGTWTLVSSSDDDGVRAYSVSGVGNQAIILDVGVAGAFTAWRTLTTPRHPQMATGTVYVPGTPPQPAPFDPLAAHKTSGLAPQPSLPSVPALDTQSAPLSIITITADNKILFDHTPVDASQVGDFLRAKKAAQEDLQILIHVDKSSAPATLDTVEQAGASAGFGVLPHEYSTDAIADVARIPTPAAPDTRATPDAPAPTNSPPDATSPAPTTPP